MGTVFDILGLTHVAVTCVAQSITALKGHMDAFRSLTPLLVSAEEKTGRIKQSISLLQGLAEVSSLDSGFFERTLCNIQDVQQELTSIEAEIANNSTAARFFFAPRLRRRLVDIIEQLYEMDCSLSAVGMIGEVFTRKLSDECSNLRERMDTRFDELNVVVHRVLKSSCPVVAAESILDLICNSDDASFDGRFHRRPALDLIASENEGHLFFALGRSHYDGDRDGHKDFPRAARYLHAAFEQGYTPAALYLGNLFYYGHGVDLSYKTSFQYYTVGARSGDAAAMSSLAWMHAFGCGVEVNSRLAVKWNNEAAKKGDGLGLWEAGYFALYGNATRQNFSKAVRYFKGALRAGETRAGEQLGLCYLNGIVVDRDPSVAHKLLRMAYETTHGETTIFWLGNFYEEMEQDYVRASKLYKEVADLQTPLARNYSCYYGLSLIRGLGVTQDIDTGLELVRKSLTPGWSSGWFVLGDMFRNGYGVRRNVSKAVRYYAKAVLCSDGAHGIVSADKALAELYEMGDGVEQSWTKAAHHYVRAASRMDRTAQWKAGSFFETGIGVDEDVRRAFVFFDMSARSGHVSAQRKAGELYMRGKGIERDRSKAMRLLEDAAERGDSRALSLLRRARLQNLLRWRRTSTD